MSPLRRQRKARNFEVGNRSGGSSPQVSEFLFEKRVILRACLLSCQPLHVALKPEVVVWRSLARFQGSASLPVGRLLVAVLVVCQLPKLAARIRIGDGLQRALEGLPRLSDQGLGLARQDFLCHLQDGLILPQVALLPITYLVGELRGRPRNLPLVNSG